MKTIKLSIMQKYILMIGPIKLELLPIIQASDEIAGWETLDKVSISSMQNGIA